MNPRTPVTIKVSFHSGQSEPWVKCETPHGTVWIPGHRSIDDVVLRVHGW